MTKVGRPRLDSGALEKLSLMVPPALMQELNAYLEEQQREKPLTKLTRSDVCRDILANFLMQRHARRPARRTSRKGANDAA